MSLAHETSLLPMPEMQRITALFGGARVLKHRVTDRLEAHEMLQQGMPSQALLHLIEGLSILRDPISLEKAVGISLRTIQRRKETPGKALSAEQGGRAWKFAEVLAQATDVMGNQDNAERWLERPALALNGRRPIDLLTTPAGIELVQQLLGRLKYGVYT
ncbi:antitoxin Xre/MbcA/ParS toxin-binding domain-containing protein [Bosea sp. (in: a-proteobacteria)]|jgi:putative toxin-antitoxin system antitoxin component (TIGR02293 family)|uniref:type II RES/Xre toxin-antitoxin system antitoxin n=1 Tax=Bosea sp. (in: a-proteobacteria) TaxID=1871050 RepID=UPI0035682C18